MRRAGSVALLSVVFAILGVGQARAQLAPTEATIRFFEQAGGLSSGISRSPLEPAARRMYATHFDAARSRYIGIEVRLVHADAAPGIASGYRISCQYIEPDGDTMGPFLIGGFVVQSDRTSAIAASIWGSAEPGTWAPGTYRAVCLDSGRSLGEATFQMTSNPPDVAGVDARVAQIRLFPISGQTTPIADRQYATVFPAAQTTRVGVELNFAHRPLGRAIDIPVDCYYFLPDGQTMGPISFTYQPQADWNGGSAGSGFGWDQPGQWPRGQYTVVCMIHGRPVAVERFQVD